MSELPKTFCGSFAILGLPNAGKSTLLNKLLNFKVAAVHAKPQMTRRNLNGILTDGDTQLIFIDTPGYQKRSEKMNKRMRQDLFEALDECDGVILLVGADQKTPDDLFRLFENTAQDKPGLVVVNKCDTVTDYQLPDAFRAYPCFPISAKTGEGLVQLTAKLREICPEHPFLYPEDDITALNMREITSQILLEKIMAALGQEIPYQCGVQIESFKEHANPIEIAATLIVNRESQKGMVIGKGGQSLKKIGTAARQDLEKMLDNKVRLELFVRVDPGWIKDKQKLEDYR